MFVNLLEVKFLTTHASLGVNLLKKQSCTPSTMNSKWASETPHNTQNSKTNSEKYSTKLDLAMVSCTQHLNIVN